MNQLLRVWVFMVACKITRGNPCFDLADLFTDAVYADNTLRAPRGFHYEPGLTIRTTYPRTNTYRVMPLIDALGVYAERAGATRRSKRGFFNALWPGGGKSEGAAVAVEGSAVAVEGSAVAVEGSAVAVEVATSSDKDKDEDDEGYLDRIGSAVAVAAGNVESGLVAAAPYLPMVAKVAMFVVPGIREYHMLMMALSVATITSQAYQRYNDGESATTVAASAAWQMFTLSKRNTDYTLKEYAQNMYDSLKESLASRFGHFSMSSSKSDDYLPTTDLLTSKTEVVSSIDENVGLLGTDNGMKTITTTVTKKKYKNSGDTPAILMSIRKYFKNDDEMVDNQISTSGEMTVSAMSQTPTTDEASDESKGEDTSEDKKDKNEEIKIDKSLFDKYLSESMRLQPKFIQQKSGEELVEFLDSVKINLPSSLAIDSSKTFYALTRTMNFDDSVTEEQINRLVDVLTKATNYFIDAAIHTKLSSTTQVETS